MLPHDDHIGIQLTYGLEGSAALNVEAAIGDRKDTVHNALSLARCRRKHRAQLRCIPDSFRVVSRSRKDSAANDYAQMSVNANTDIVSSIFPPSLVNQVDLSEPTSGSGSYDPTFGNLIAVCDINGMNRLRMKLLVIAASGEGKDVITFCLIDKSKDIRPDMAVAPPFKNTYAVSISSRIKQIELEQVTPQAVVAAVRTDDTIYMLRLLITKFGSLEINKIDEISKEAVAGEELAWVSMDIVDHRLVGVLDIMGNFAVFKLTAGRPPFYSRCLKQQLEFSTFNDPTELSHFKRIIFNREKERFYLISRTSLHEFNLKNGSLRCRVIAGAWTKILDFVAVDLQRCLFVMLTSKELILVDASHGFKRLLAWKHYLSESDSSWKVNLVEASENREYIFLIRSQIINLNYAIEMNVGEKGISSPRIIDDTYYVLTHPSRPVQSLVSWKVAEGLYVCFQILSDLEISSCLLKLSTEENKFTYPTDPSNVVIPDINSDSGIAAKNVFAKLPDFKDPEKRDVCQELCLSFKKLLKEEEGSFSRFLSECCAIPSGALPKNRRFLNDILQLMEYFHSLDQGISLSFDPEVWRVSERKETQKIENFDGFNEFQEISKFFQRLQPSGKETDVSRILSMCLSLSLITVTKRQPDDRHVSQEIEDIEKRLPDDIQGIVSSFETDMNLPSKFDDVDESVGMSQLQVGSSQEISIPQVSQSSQHRLRPKNKLFARKSVLQVGMSQRSEMSSQSERLPPAILDSQESVRVSSSQTASQGIHMSQNGRPAKKRKKKKTGFM
ncbi:DEKNAAC105549 [Brettanomyces naardenensis]|uniref:DEKNAAC105549 n=1 Tax=Brettanomyces naardenensis TaxID=13370 RepID=A0A448YU41_BRENA|nr:DEKNAAC105549 [Brettanomyces naardenensis]